MIMHKSIAVCNPKIEFFADFFGPTKHLAKLSTNLPVLSIATGQDRLDAVQQNDYFILFCVT